MTTKSATRSLLLGSLIGLALGTALAQPGGSSWTICKDACTTKNGCPLGTSGKPYGFGHICYIADNGVNRCREGRWNLYNCVANPQNQQSGWKFDTTEYIAASCTPQEDNCVGS